MRRRIKKLITCLESLPHSEISHLNNLGFYPFSNEREFSTPFKILLKRKPDVFPHGTIRIAILIGESSFCSLLVALSGHCDLIVFTDINPRMIAHTRKLLSLLQTSEDRKDFEKRYNAVKTDLLPYFKSSEATPDLALRKITLGKYHFLYNDANFNDAKQASLKIKFAFCHVNLFHENDSMTFFKIFKERKLRRNQYAATRYLELRFPIYHKNIPDPIIPRFKYFKKTPVIQLPEESHNMIHKHVLPTRSSAPQGDWKRVFRYS